MVILFLRLAGVDESTRKISLAAKLRRLDFPGAVLIIASVSSLFLALQEGGTIVPWNSARPIGLLVGFALILILFGAWQWKAGENATIPLRYLRDRTVLWGSIYLFWDNMASYIVCQSHNIIVNLLIPCRQSTIYHSTSKQHLVRHLSGALLATYL
jgi:protein-S-isoprenylcysteine O-methyltransferase Ste14